jgi:hypothetical protein
LSLALSGNAVCRNQALLLYGSQNQHQSACGIDGVESFARRRQTEGLDKLSMDEINAQIAMHRREKRPKAKRPKAR